MIDKRYIRNLNALSEEDQQRLSGAKVCVAGCGGLGGYVIEILARLGVGHLTAVDGDVFDETNLNRQILCEPDFLGKKKAAVAGRRVAKINPDVELTPVTEFVTADNGEDILKGHDIVIDALDNPSDRLLIKNICGELGITMVHGAIGGWYGQLSVVRPGDDVLDKLYESARDRAQPTMGNPSFVPPAVASMEAAECIKVLLNKGTPLYGKLLTIDLLENEFEIIEF